MLFDGIKLTAGSEFQNLTVDLGTAFPTTPNNGELFYRTDSPNMGLYIYENSSWIRQLGQGDSLVNLLPTNTSAGTYTKVSVSSTGLVTGGITPTTLAGYSITDAQPLDSDLTAIANITATYGLLKKTAANTWTLDTNAYLTGNQTITLSGDLVGSGTTTITANLGTTGVTAGSYGSATSVATFTVDQKGRLSAASSVPVAIDATAITSGTIADLRIAQSSVTQYQSNLTILESQITAGSILARVMANENIGGLWSFYYPVTGVTPTSSTHLATKGYVDTAIGGISASYTITGDVTGTVGGSNVLTLATVNSTVGTYGSASLIPVVTVNAKGLVTNVTTASITTSFTVSGDVTGTLSSGSGSLTLASVATPVTNTFSKFTLNSKGLITATTAVSSSDLTTALGYTPVNKAGDTMGGILNLGGNQLTGLPATPVATGAASKEYVDAAITGLAWKNPVRVISTTAGTLATSFANGSIVDGVTLATNDRILIVGQATSSEDGLYVVNATGAPTRATDGATYAELNSSAVFVQSGTQYHDTGWVQGNVLTSFTGQGWVQFAGGALYTAGTGLTLTGNQFSVILGAGIGELPTGDVGVDLYSTGGLMLTVDGSTTSTDAAAQLSLAKVGIAGTYTSVITDAYGRVTGGSNPTITSLGTISTGVWQASVISSTYGGTGLNNGGRTLAINTNSGALTFSAASTTLTVVANASISGTNTGDQTTVTGQAGFVANSVTFAATGGATAGSTFNGSSALTVSYATIGAQVAGSYLVPGGALGTPASGTLTNCTGLPNSSVIGLGTMATQNASSVAITGGTLNGVTIGGTSAGAGTFTTISGAGTGLTGTAASLTVGTATNVAAGSGGNVIYQSGAGATAFVTNGAGVLQALTSGANPAWTTTPTLTGTNFTGIPYSAMTGTVPTWNQNTTGTAASATTATNVAGTGITGTTLASNVVTSSLTSVGTLGTLTVTGASSLNGTTIPATSTLLVSGGALGTPSAGTLTNCTGLLYSGLTGTVPTWNQSTTGNAATATVATNMAGGAAGNVSYQSSANNSAFVTNGAGVLQAASSGATPAWTTTPTLTGTNFTGVPNTALSNSSITITAGTGLSGGGTVALGGTVTLSATGSSTISVTGGTQVSATPVPLITSDNTTAGTTNASATMYSHSTLTFTPSTSTLTAGSFTGAGTGLTGTATALNIGGNATSASTATTVSITSVSAANNTNYIPVMSTTNGSSITLYGNSAGGFYYNPSTTTLTAPIFAGAGTNLTGTAASLTAGTATNAVNVGTTSNTTSTTTYIGSFLSSSGNMAMQLSTKLSHNCSTGDFTATGNVGAYSDARLKTDLVQITDAVSKVELLTGYTYTRIDTGARQAGLIAQDVQQVLPEVVAEAEDGTLTVAYGNMMGLMVEAVKELKAGFNAELSTLRAELDAVKAELAALKGE